MHDLIILVLSGKWSKLQNGAFIQTLIYIIFMTLLLASDLLQKHRGICVPISPGM